MLEQALSGAIADVKSSNQSQSRASAAALTMLEGLKNRLGQVLIAGQMGDAYYASGPTGDRDYWVIPFTSTDLANTTMGITASGNVASVYLMQLGDFPEELFVGQDVILQPNGVVADDRAHRSLFNPESDSRAVVEYVFRDVERWDPENMIAGVKLWNAYTPETARDGPVKFLNNAARNLDLV